jgi:hypothetical protein
MGIERRHVRVLNTVLLQGARNFRLSHHTAAYQHHGRSILAQPPSHHRSSTTNVLA